MVKGEALPRNRNAYLPDHRRGEVEVDGQAHLDGVRGFGGGGGGGNLVQIDLGGVLAEVETLKVLLGRVLRKPGGSGGRGGVGFVGT